MLTHLDTPRHTITQVSIVCYYAAFFPFMAFSVHFLVSARGMPHKCVT